MPDLTLTAFNTLTIVAGEVYRLKGQPGGIHRSLDVLNLGPGSIWLRADADPDPADTHSLLLPPNMGQNSLSVDATTGLGVIADADTTLSVRVS